MKYLTALSLAVSLVCFDSFSQGITSFTTSETEHYELVKPNNEPMGVLILFGGFPETPDVIKREFEIIEPAMEAGIAMALMKFNRRLWLEKNEKKQLSAIVN